MMSKPLLKRCFLFAIALLLLWSTYFAISTGAKLWRGRSSETYDRINEAARKFVAEENRKSGENIKAGSVDIRIQPLPECVLPLKVKWETKRWVTGSSFGARSGETRYFRVVEVTCPKTLLHWEGEWHLISWSAEVPVTPRQVPHP